MIFIHPQSLYGLRQITSRTTFELFVSFLASVSPGMWGITCGALFEFENHEKDSRSIIFKSRVLMLNNLLTFVWRVTVRETELQFHWQNDVTPCVFPTDQHPRHCLASFDTLYKNRLRFRTEKSWKIGHECILLDVRSSREHADFGGLHIIWSKLRKVVICKTSTTIKEISK